MAALNVWLHVDAQPVALTSDGLKSMDENETRLITAMPIPTMNNFLFIIPPLCKIGLNILFVRIFFYGLIYRRLLVVCQEDCALYQTVENLHMHCIAI